MKNRIFILSLMMLVTVFGYSQKEYVKEYYPDGTIQQEGWMQDGMRIKYWYFYHPNGKKMKEGHYKNDKEIKYWKIYDDNGVITHAGHCKNGQKHKWWVFYKPNGDIDKKCQYKNDVIDGYCLVYEGNKLAKASKFADGKFIKEWKDKKSFLKENKRSDLR